MIRLIKKIKRWAEKPPGSRIVITVLSLSWMLFMAYDALSTRIGKTGWECFPATMLDWFAIVGSAGFLCLSIYGAINVVVYIKK